MKKILFISNITNKITNFSLPSIVASQDLGYEFHLAANLENFKDDTSKYGIKTHHIDLVRNPFSPKNVRAYQQMISLLKQEKFDVIHCNTPIGGILGRVCGNRLEVPKIIYTAHGFHFYKGGPFVKNSIFKFAENYLARYTDTIITMNEEDYLAAQRFKLKNKGSTYYVPGVGVDSKKYVISNSNEKEIRQSLGLKEDSVILIAMGDLIKRKNYSASIKSIAKANNPNLHFIICGKGPELENLKKQAEELGVGNQIHFLGFRTDIKELLAISDIFLFTTYQEGLPRSMMEAMASGLPCIASKVRGNVDLINSGEGGYLCEINDIEQLSFAINTLAEDANLRKKMGLHNLDIIRKFDIENIKLEMSKIYSKELI